MNREWRAAPDLPWLPLWSQGWALRLGGEGQEGQAHGDGDGGGGRQALGVRPGIS